ncbi:unnamed protein product, partial [Musa acuminata subsp. malaccensis]
MFDNVFVILFFTLENSISKLSGRLLRPRSLFATRCPLPTPRAIGGWGGSTASLARSAVPSGSAPASTSTR